MSLTAAHQTITHAVVETVAEAENVDPLDLDPLYGVIDPDALEELFTATAGSPRSSGKITFEYHGHTVVVSNDGSVTLADSPALLEK